MATEPAQIRHLVDRAVRIARDQRTVTCVIVPNDLDFEARSRRRPRAHGTIHSAVGYAAPRVVPADAELRARGRDPERGRAGRDARRRGRARRPPTRSSRSPTLLGAGVAKALLGKAVVPDDLPYVTGSIGLLGTKPSWDLMTGCDTLLMVGSSFPYSEFLPEEGQARGVQIDIDARMIGIRYPMEVQPRRRRRGDARGAAAAARAQERPRLARGDRGGRRRLVAADGRARARRCRPDQPAARLLRALARACPTACILTSDSGSAANWYARDIRIRRGHDGLALGNAGDDGPGRAVRDRRQVRPSRPRR